MEEAGGDLLGALHAAEHALISVLPLLAMCDRWDIGGLSTNIHPQTLRPTVFVYDGHAGGVGIAQRGHERFAELVASAARVVGDCRCRDGCPSCVQSPKCGNLNEMLDKAAAARLLAAMGRPERPPREPAGRLAQLTADRAAQVRAGSRARAAEPDSAYCGVARSRSRSAQSGHPPRSRPAQRADPPAASRRRSRTPRAPGRADAPGRPRSCRVTPAQHGAVEPVHVAQEQQVAVGGSQAARAASAACSTQSSTRERSSSPVVPGARGRARRSSPPAPAPYSHSCGCGRAARRRRCRSRQPTASAPTRQRSPSPRPPSMRALYENSGVS